MQRTAKFHDQIADTLLPQAESVFDDATALHTAVDMLTPQPTLIQGLVGQLLFQRQLLATRFLRRHEDVHLGQREGQEAQILSQPTPSGQGIRRRLGDALLMDTAAVGLTQEEDGEWGIDQQDIFPRVILFLAAITVRLFSSILGAADAPFGAVMGKRGDTGAAAGAAAGGSSSRGTATAAAALSETPSRCARAVRERAGVSPRVRSAAWRAGNRT
jgi:hypothetical protein